MCICKICRTSVHIKWRGFRSPLQSVRWIYLFGSLTGLTLYFFFAHPNFLGSYQIASRVGSLHIFSSSLNTFHGLFTQSRTSNVLFCVGTWTFLLDKLYRYWCVDQLIRIARSSSDSLKAPWLTVCNRNYSHDNIPRIVSTGSVRQVQKQSLVRVLCRCIFLSWCIAMRRYRWDDWNVFWEVLCI